MPSDISTTTVILPLNSGLLVSDLVVSLTIALSDIDPTNPRLSMHMTQGNCGWHVHVASSSCMHLLDLKHRSAWRCCEEKEAESLTL